MVPLASLWLPILVSAVFVFVASSVIHMALKYHHSDYSKVPSEDEVMEAMRKFSIPPGDYFMPRAEGSAEMKSPEYKKKAERGPVVVFTVIGKDGFAMGKRLFQWFVYIVFVSLFAGCVAAGMIGPGAPYRVVFHVVAMVAFAGYALALWQTSIWYKRPWGTTFRTTVDGLIYGCLTAGTFGWLWPK